ncbi:purine-cytosine permease family protein [Microbacterium gorillae]|uniref:purine-cytosine permease family protein n=1 Tax=Microbacterium gorillae TaxID=1231063 RepID=UPI000590018B|nr:cytosine permease [Microbacterium gorillae]
MSTDAGVKPTLIEHNGIDIVPEEERTARPRDLFWPWFAANVSVFGMSYGSYLLGFGISLWQATIVAILGIVISFFLCGLVAIAGKRGSAPTMVLSRAAFGVQGQKLPGIISWITSIGWETILAITAVLATGTVFRQLGWFAGGDVAVNVVATIVVAALIVGAAVLGYHTIMKLQSVLTWVTGLMTILFLVLTFGYIDWNVIGTQPSGNLGQMIGALVFTLTGFGLGWINIAADWTRYQKRTVSDAKIVGWNTFGGSIAPIFLVFFGLLLAASNKTVTIGGQSMGLNEAIGNDPIGALSSILPTWLLFPFLIVAILTQVSGAVLGIYSSGLTLLSLGIKIPRPAAAAIDGVILTIGTILVVFFAQNFIGPFQTFLTTLGVPLAAWAGILIADILRRRKPYDTEALFDSNGRYGAVDWISVGTFVVAIIIGWGFVLSDLFTWQGYFMGLVGGVKGEWAGANLGVLFALAIGFLVTFFARAGVIRRQEEGL